MPDNAMPATDSTVLAPGLGRQLVWLVLTVLVVVFDQATKYIADEVLSYARPVEILPVFDLMLVYNKGAAFSFLSEAGGWQRWFFTALSAGVSVMLVAWLYRLKRHETWVAIGLALILGGALGNLYDRVMFGYVIDFVSLHYSEYYFPAFNVADSAISAGAIMLIIDLVFLSGKDKDDAASEGESS